MFDVENVGIISSACICNGRRGRLQFEWPGRDSKKQGGAVYPMLDYESLSPVTIPGDEILWKAFNYGVHCHWLKLRLNSVLIFTVTATSEGLFAPLEGSLSCLGAILIVLHSFCPQYFERSILYIFSFLMELPLSQSTKHRKANNEVFSVLWHQLRVLVPLQGIGSRVGCLHCWKNLGTTQFAPRCTRSEW
jgi:hypothetical protein